MFLSLILLNKPEIDQVISLTILFHCSFIALLTLTVNGLTTKMVVQKLHLSKESSTSKKFMWMFIERIAIHSQEKQNDFLKEHAQGQQIHLDKEQLYEDCLLTQSH
jgi:hypothetical protein